MLMGIVEYSAHRNCGIQAVQEAIARGRISINGDNLIDVEAADRDWDQNTNLLQARRREPILMSTTGSPGEPPPKKPTEAVPGITYTDARALREVYDAQRRQLELQARRGELVNREEVEREAYRLYRQLRDACMNLPPRLAAQLAAETDEAACHDLLESELQRVFSDFAEGRLT